MSKDLRLMAQKDYWYSSEDIIRYLNVLNSQFKEIPDQFNRYVAVQTPFLFVSLLLPWISPILYIVNEFVSLQTIMKCDGKKEGIKDNYMKIAQGMSNFEFNIPWNSADYVSV